MELSKSPKIKSLNQYMAGRLGKVITSGLIELGWIKKSLSKREVGITEDGKEFI